MRDLSFHMNTKPNVINIASPVLAYLDKKYNRSQGRLSKGWWDSWGTELVWSNKGLFGKLNRCCKPPSYVPYKGTYVPYDGTFGAPDQGQTLDVWGDIQQMSTQRCQWHSYVKKSPSYPGRKSCTNKDITGGISAMILDHTDRNQRYFRSIANPVRRT